MSLHILPDLTQGTEEWLAARRGIVTASVVGKLISATKPGAIDYQCPTCDAPADHPCVSVAKGKAADPIKTLHPRRVKAAEDAAPNAPTILTVADTDESRRLTDTLATERVTGFTDPTYINNDMWRGIDDEPRAVEVYSQRYAPVETVGFMVREFADYSIGYSPDGLVGDDGLIEVKSRRSYTQFRHVIDGEVPAYNMAQLQCGLLVSGRRWIDYVSFAGGMHLWTKRVTPNEGWFAVILAAVERLEANAAESIAAYNAATEGLAMTERPTELEMVI